MHGVQALKYRTNVAWFQSAGGEQRGQGDAGDVGNCESGRGIGAANESCEEVGDGKGDVLVEKQFASQGRRRLHLGNGIRAEDQAVE